MEDRLIERAKQMRERRGLYLQERRGIYVLVHVLSRDVPNPNPNLIIITLTPHPNSQTTGCHLCWVTRECH